MTELLFGKNGPIAYKPLEDTPRPSVSHTEYRDLAQALETSDASPKQIRRALLQWMGLPVPMVHEFGSNTDLSRTEFIDTIVMRGGTVQWHDVDGRPGGHTPVIYTVDDPTTHPPSDHAVRIMERIPGVNRRPFRFAFDQQNRAIFVESGPIGYGSSEVWEGYKKQPHDTEDVEIEKYDLDNDANLPEHITHIVKDLSSRVSKMRALLRDKQIDDLGIVGLEAFYDTNSKDWIFVDLDLPAFDAQQWMKDVSSARIPPTEST